MLVGDTKSTQYSFNGSRWGGIAKEVLYHGLIALLRSRFLQFLNPLVDSIHVAKDMCGGSFILQNGRK